MLVIQGDDRNYITLRNKSITGWDAGDHYSAWLNLPAVDFKQTNPHFYSEKTANFIVTIPKNPYL